MLRPNSVAVTVGSCGRGSAVEVEWEVKADADADADAQVEVEDREDGGAVDIHGIHEGSETLFDITASFPMPSCRPRCRRSCPITRRKPPTPWTPDPLSPTRLVTKASGIAGNADAEGAVVPAEQREPTLRSR